MLLINPLCVARLSLAVHGQCLGIWASFEVPRTPRAPCATDKGQFGVAARGGGHLSPGQS